VYVICPTCHGRKIVDSIRGVSFFTDQRGHFDRAFGNHIVDVPCPLCMGVGEVLEELAVGYRIFKSNLSPHAPLIPRYDIELLRWDIVGGR